MNAFAWSSLLTAILTIGLGLFVFFGNKKNRINQLWLLVSVYTSLWTIGLFGSVVSLNEDQALFWQRVLYLGTILLPAAFFHYAVTLIEQNGKYTRLVYAQYIVSVLFAALVPSSYFITGVKSQTSFGYWPVDTGFIYIIFLAYFITSVFYSLRLLYLGYRSETGDRSKQLLFMLIASVIGFVGGSTNFVLDFNLGIYPVGNFFVAFYVVVMAYAIIKHKLFNVKVLTAALFGSILVGFSILEIVTASGLNNRIYRVAIFLLTSVFVILLVRSVLKDIRQKELLEKLTDQLKNSNVNLESKATELQKVNTDLSSATHQLQDVNTLLTSRNQRLNTLQKFSSVILQSYRLEEMSQRIIDYIPGEIEHCDMAFLVMVDEAKKEAYWRTISQPYAIARQIIRLLGTNFTKYRISLTNNDNLIARAINTKEIQITKDLYDFMRPTLSKTLVWALQNIGGAMSSAVAVPLIVRGQVTGALAFTFGVKRSPLTEEDKLLLQAVGDQVGIALERTRVYDELEKLNERLNEANHYLQQLDQAKSEFLSIASHQLRTPTTGIKGFLSMMLEGDYGKVTKEQRDVLQIVYDSTNRLIRLVNVFLNVSRIESGKLQLARNEVDLGNLARVVVTELRPAAKAKNLTLDIQTPDKVPIVPADSDKIRDVLVNLTDNAIKYTEKGSVTVRVVPHADSVEVAVADTGMGLSSDEIKALFAKFSRGERVKIKESQGSGLGLFIAKKIIEPHSGKIGVTSPGPGKGTTFSFTLPLKPPVGDAGVSTLPTNGEKKGEGK